MTSRICSPRRPSFMGLGEPEVAVLAGSDPVGAAAGGDAGAVFGNDTGRRNLRDPVSVELGEPEVAVGAGSDPLGAAGDAGTVFGDDTGRRDLRDPVAGGLG